MLSPILVSGIPGCGKSTFGRWLESERGWLYVDMEHDGLDRSGLRSAWEAYHSQSDTIEFPKVLSRISKPVVLDWGFPTSCLPTVARLKSNGIGVWWFDGDRLSARQLFENRRTVPVAAFDQQFAEISEHWSKIAPVFAGRIVRVVSPNGSRLSNEEIYRAIV